MQMSLECYVEITIRSSPDKAETIQRALEPDNIDFPPGLSLDVRCKDDSIILDFKSHNTRTLISSVDEVLEHISVAMRVME